MAEQGYFPSRDRMRLVHYKAAKLRRTFVEWWKDSKLPGFPLNSGNIQALKEMYELDCALNPNRLSWEDPRRSSFEERVWNDRTVSGLNWLRNLLDILLKRALAESLTTVRDFHTWANSSSAMPEGVSIQRDELKAFRRAIERIDDELERFFDPDESDLLEVERKLHESIRRLAPGATGDRPVVDECPIALVGPGRKPRVEGGGACKNLSQTRYDVLAAVVSAYPKYLNGNQLTEQSKHGDAVNIFKDLIKENPHSLGRFMHAPGAGGRGYGIRRPQIPRVDEQKPTEDPQKPIDFDGGSVSEVHECHGNM